MVLYRSPDIVIDEFEFHISLEVRDGRVRRFTRWRPASSTKRVAWRPIADFKGYPPKARVWRTHFKGCERHICMAERSIEAKRAEARRLAERQAKFAT
jgi:hypothetical protein